MLQDVNNETAATTADARCYISDITYIRLLCLLPLVLAVNVVAQQSGNGNREQHGAARTYTPAVEAGEHF